MTDGELETRGRGAGSDPEGGRAEEGGRPRGFPIDRCPGGGRLRCRQLLPSPLESGRQDPHLPGTLLQPRRFRHSPETGGCIGDGGGGVRLPGRLRSSDRRPAGPSGPARSDPIRLRPGGGRLEEPARRFPCGGRGLEGVGWSRWGQERSLAIDLLGQPDFTADALRLSEKIGPEKVVAEIERSGLQGRGGTGTYDSGLISQAGARDQEVDSSPNSCS